MTAANRYRACAVLELDGRTYLGTRKFVDYPRRDDDVFHTIRQEDAIDLLAQKYYGDSGLWWIIADYNGISFPLELPDPGTVIRLPSYQYAMLEMAGGR